MDTDDSFSVAESGLRRAVQLLEESPGLAGEAELPAVGEAGCREEAVLERLAPFVLSGATALGAPGFFAHMDPPTPWISWAMAMWNARLNQNLLHPEVSPVARRVERLVIDWFAPRFGMDGGQMVPGSTVANLTAIWAAREVAGVTEVVASTAAHVSVAKAAHLLGLRLRQVPDFEPATLGDLTRSALVMTAGTTATGMIEPLGAGAGAAWRHVDAAWAGPLYLSARHAGLLAGIDHADSVAISAHKWLFQPKESALVLFARAEKAEAALSFGGAYLAAPNVGLLGSHGAAAVPLYATLLAWGREGLVTRIDRCMELAAELAERIAAEPAFELRGAPMSGVVVWRPRGADPELVRRGMEGAFVSLVRLEGEVWWRSVAANPMAEPAVVIEAAKRAVEAVSAGG